MHVKVVRMRVERFVHAAGETWLFWGVEYIAPIRGGRIRNCVIIFGEVIICFGQIFDGLDRDLESIA